MTAQLPDIYLFNPTCEYAVANERASWQPNRLLQKMEEDLGTLPLFFTQSHDVVLVKKIPSAEYLVSLQKIGVMPPGFVGISSIISNRTFVNEPKNRLLPWGWSPAVHGLLESLKTSCSDEFKKSPVAYWSPDYREIYSKKFALEILKLLLPKLPPEIVLPPHFLPEVCTAKEELETLLLRWGKLMVKSPWSSSGRGLHRITKTPVVAKVWEKIMGTIKDQGYAIAEPFLEKVLDMAFLFELRNGKVHFLGISRFLTNEKGQYQGNFLNGWPAEMDSVTKKFAESLPDMLINPLIKTIESSTLVNLYEGIFGVDTLIFKDDQGTLRVNPCLEMNVRQTMGLLSLQLEKLIVPGRKGTFKISYQSGKSFIDFQNVMAAKFPAKFKNTKVESGFFPLIPVNEGTLFGAYILVT